MADNIQVVVRCRARSRQEVAAKSPPVVALPNDEYSADEPFVTITGDPMPTLSGGSRAIPAAGKSFRVDQVYGPNADQALLFNNVALPLFEDFVSGFNVTILAYGQTGSGKTYSMFGDLNGEDAGIIPRVLNRLFTSIDADYSVKISCVELYKEELRDLIGDGYRMGPQKGKIWLAPGHAKDAKATVIQNLQEVYIDSCKMGFDILKKCFEKRKTSSTKLNDASSRSHTMFSISLCKKKDPSTQSSDYTTSTMTLVDLAGSEDINKSGAVNERAREAGSINQSLLALGKVISALSEGKELGHIPYRESKLTRILQGSIGGRTKTALIATISPAKVNVFETVSTLNYASKAKNIKNIPQFARDIETIHKSVLISDLNKQLALRDRDRLAANTKDGYVKISLENQDRAYNAQKEYEVNMKEKETEIAKLQAKLQAKTAEHEQKYTALEAQSREEIDLCRQNITRMENENKKLEALTNERQEEFSTVVGNLRGIIDMVFTTAYSFTSSNEQNLANFDQQKNSVSLSLLSAQQKLNFELNKAQNLFNHEWKDEIDRHLKKELNLSSHFEKIKTLDVNDEVSQFEGLDGQTQAEIDRVLSWRAYYDSMKATERMVKQAKERIMESHMKSYKEGLESVFGALQHDAINACKENFTHALSERKSEASQTLKVFSNKRSKLTQSIAEKASECIHNVSELEREFDRKRDGASATILREASSRVHRGIHPLLDLNQKQGSDAIALVDQWSDHTRAFVCTANETLRATLDAAKKDTPLPLSEIQISNVPQPSPKRSQIMAHSPQRFEGSAAKRRKPTSPVKFDPGNFRSQIPQLSLKK